MNIGMHNWDQESPSPNNTSHYLMNYTLATTNEKVCQQVSMFHVPVLHA